jgi:hypothetical protein
MPARWHPGAAALGEEFPHWTLWVSGTGRLWASRRALTAADQAAGCVAFLHADGPDALAGQLRVQEALRPRRPASARPPLGRQAHIEGAVLAVRLSLQDSVAYQQGRGGGAARTATTSLS